MASNTEKIAVGLETPDALISGLTASKPVFSDSNKHLTSTGTVPVNQGGTGATTANTALNALLPTQTSNANKFLQTDGTNTSWATGAGGITTLNTLTASTQTFAVGTSGSDFNISSSTSTHTFNLPDAGASARGAVTTGTQTLAGAKTFSSVVAVTVGSASAPSVGFTGNTNTGFYSSASNFFDITTAGVQRLSIGGGSGNGITHFIESTGGGMKWQIDSTAGIADPGTGKPALWINTASTLTEYLQYIRISVNAGSTTGVDGIHQNWTGTGSGTARTQKAFRVSGGYSGNALNFQSYQSVASFGSAQALSGNGGTGIFGAYLDMTNSDTTTGSGVITTFSYAEKGNVKVAGQFNSGVGTSSGSTPKAFGILSSVSTTDNTTFNAGYFHLGSASNAAFFDSQPATNSALFVDNGDSAVDIIIAQSNGTTVFNVADSGVIKLGATSTTPQHIINSSTGTTGSDVLTMTNGVSGTAGNPAGYLKFTINGTTRYVPFW